jgi:hypothetical protein
MQIKTHISCTLKDCKKCTPKSPKATLDKLLKEGFEIPDEIYNNWLEDNPHQPFVLLITGEPGTGKTTFALELAYRWADKGHIHIGKNNAERPIPLNTFYFSSESNGNILLNSKVKELGWDTKRFIYDQPADVIRDGEGWVALYGTEQLKDNPSNNEMFFKTLRKDWMKWLRFQENQAGFYQLGRMIFPKQPALVIIDSLNIFDSIRKQKDAFRDIISDSETQPLVLAIVLDNIGTGETCFWDYVADMVLEFERINLSIGTDPLAYNMGTFEIKKARWQEHAFGCHQIKILKESDPQKSGMCIYPSLQFSLAEKNRSIPIQQLECETTFVGNLDNLICSGDKTKEEDRRWAGFPMKNCTAMVGVRGTKKSHLAYNWLLKNAIESEKTGKKCLLVSLQDDESTAKTRLGEIAYNEGMSPEFIAGLKNSKIIPVTYFKPGYITPSEFLFKLQLDLDKYEPARVVINAFEQLETLFPLCAAQPLFVSSIIRMLCDREITSVATGVISSGPSGSEIGHGLLPVSSMVLRFDRKLLPFDSLPDDYKNNCGNKSESEKLKTQGQESSSKIMVSETIVETNRVPSGRDCGGNGILYLDASNKLCFTQLPAPVIDT